jgi:hypothetical protein
LIKDSPKKEPNILSQENTELPVKELDKANPTIGTKG